MNSAGIREVSSTVPLAFCPDVSCSCSILLARYFDWSVDTITSSTRFVRTHPQSEPVRNDCFNTQMHWHAKIVVWNTGRNLRDSNVALLVYQSLHRQPSKLSPVPCGNRVRVGHRHRSGSIADCHVQ